MVRSRQRKNILPTCKQMKNPAQIPANGKIELSKIGLWLAKPLHLFRITWCSEPVSQDGGIGGVNQFIFHSGFWRWIYAN